MGNFTNPDYIQHGADYDLVNILACQVRVWSASSDNWFDPKAGTKYTEVESIEIHKSYKELISTATLRIPRGAMVAKSVTGPESGGDNTDKTISSGESAKKSEETSQKEATQGGQVLMDGSSVDKGGNPTLSIEASRDDTGLIKVGRKTDRLVTTDDFAVGQRIEIMVGWVHTEEEWVKVQTGKGEGLLTRVFTGFITACSPTTPVEIQCEDMASLLKKFSCNNVIAKRDYTVNDFFAAGGTFDLLKDSGLVLSDISKSTNINVGKVNLTSNLTVADVLEEWRKCGLMSFMEEDGKHLRIGRTLYTGTTKENDKEFLGYTDGAKEEIIQFDWDVAKDGINIMRHDTNFLAVDAQAIDSDGRTYGLTIRKDPGSDTNGEIKWDVVNVREKKAMKGHKRKGGESGKPKVRSKVDLDRYVRVPYISPNRNISMEELKKEAMSYWKRYCPNGVSGKVTIFGDRNILPGCIVGLIDPRQPEKNGYYLCESVTIIFSADEGYRRELTLPYKICDYTKPIKYIV